MVITSKNRFKTRIHIKNVQFRYAILYVVITFAAMLLLNIFCSEIGLSLFYASKESTMLEKCRLAAAEVGSVDAINVHTVAETISDYNTSNITRLIVTDQNGLTIYDTAENLQAANQYALFPEIVTALNGNDTFYCRYIGGSMRSVAACPMYTYGTLSGCVYMMEYDTAQSTIIAALQNTIFIITMILEIIVILSSFLSAETYSRKLKKFMSAIHIAREGDYTHRLQVSGHDELTTLGSEFNDLINRLQISENKRSQFVSDASHELKTPLASIKLLSDSILQNNMDGETVREFVEDIGNEADRLNRMSQKLLALSRNDDQIPENEAEIVHLRPTIERVIRMLSANIIEKNLTVVQDLDENPTVLILEDDLYQIVFNLVENAIKYNVNDGKLHLRLQREGDDCVFTVSDTGMGIPEESLPNIFERFYRVDKARSRSTGGSGLGLSIVRSMVEKHKGSIHVDSTVGKGTNFTVTFPVFDMEEDTL